MRQGLALAAVVPFVAAAAAHGEAKPGPFAGQLAQIATVRTIDLRIAEQQNQPQQGVFAGGMIVQHEVAPNALLGFGLAKLFTRRKGVAANGTAETVGRSRRPAVTFTLKF